MMKFKQRFKYFSTNVFPNTHFVIGELIEMTVKCVNNSGQIELSFKIPENIYIEKFQLKRELKDDDLK